jgi:excinuclease UvrABC ATPase subunit
MPRSIIIKGAREHNLKNIDVTIPRDKLVVITGLSGSGKSSLAFDTIYAEGQRRYVESLSAYARGSSNRWAAQRRFDRRVLGLHIFPRRSIRSNGLQREHGVFPESNSEE